MSARAPRATNARPARALALLGAALAAAAVAWTGHAGALLDLLHALRDAGPKGVAAFALLYAAATVLMIPGSALTLAAGALYGPVAGFAVVVLASNAGASAAFWLGRTLLRERVAAWMADHRRLQALDRAVERGGARLMLLLRLSPVIPFNLLNYAMGTTRIRFRDYLLGGAIGMVPGTLLYVVIGAGMGQLADLLRAPPDGGLAERVLFVAGLLATAAAIAMVSRLARQALDAELEALP